uniref:Uncharacterized protein n=1 Tax=Oryza brachyantha TaxID=4533 RepID=J3LAZ2_ORYBR
MAYKMKNNGPHSLDIGCRVNTVSPVAISQRKYSLLEAKVVGQSLYLSMQIASYSSLWIWKAKEKAQIMNHDANKGKRLIANEQQPQVVPLLMEVVPPLAIAYLYMEGTNGQWSHSISLRSKCY